jgi:hypothetical protein
MHSAAERVAIDEIDLCDGSARQLLERLQPRCLQTSKTKSVAAEAVAQVHNARF